MRMGAEVHAVHGGRSGQGLDWTWPAQHEHVGESPNTRTTIGDQGYGAASGLSAADIQYC